MIIKERTVHTEREKSLLDYNSIYGIVKEYSITKATEGRIHF